MRDAVTFLALLSALVAAFVSGIRALHVVQVLLPLLLLKYWKKIYCTLAVLPRDLRGVYTYVRVSMATKYFARNNTTVVSAFADLVKVHPTKPCLIFEDTIWIYKQVDEYSNKVAHVFHSLGYHKGDVIALYMNNSAEYVCIWLGLAKIGVVIALINNNLRKQPLAHSLQVASAKAVISSLSLMPFVKDVASELHPETQFFMIGGSSLEGMEIEDFDKLLSLALSTPTEAEAPGHRDGLLYIYTSGTTGLPKAALLPHSRYLMISAGVKYVFSIKDDDIIYNPLPLYHTAGGVLGVSQSLVYGITCVIRSKFSASAYWLDCIKYKCTIGQYIGEICRYLLALAPKPEDTSHKIKFMFGNGMKSAIWKEFTERFKINKILELYGATEGNSTLVNIDNTIGAIGFIPQIIPSFLTPLSLVKVNEDTNEIIRGENGFCIKCSIGEPGMIIGKIYHTTVGEFHGYVDKKETAKKVIENVFSKGDKYFVSGDILVMDEFGYLYFKDRTGDTFRWKGENVSTAEVEAIISNEIGLKNATVYGVEIAGKEGRAGMAALEDPEHTINLKTLSACFDKSLPSYARPIFIRIVDKLELTGTFKIKKVDLQKEGFNPSVVKDKLYFFSNNDYIPLTKELYDNIISGKIRL